MPRIYFWNQNKRLELFSWDILRDKEIKVETSDEGFVHVRIGPYNMRNGWKSKKLATKAMIEDLELSMADDGIYLKRLRKLYAKK